jgi:hypothetical protein
VLTRTNLSLRSRDRMRPCPVKAKRARKEQPIGFLRNPDAPINTKLTGRSGGGLFLTSDRRELFKHLTRSQQTEDCRGANPRPLRRNTTGCKPIAILSLRLDQKQAVYFKCLRGNQFVCWRACRARTASSPASLYFRAASSSDRALFLSPSASSAIPRWYRKVALSGTF